MTEMGPHFSGKRVPERILGIDPGLHRTGYAVLDRSASGPVLREGGIVRSTVALSLAELRELRKEVTFAIYAEVDDLDRVARIVDNLFSLLAKAYT